MSRKKFTPEEIIILRKNPFTKNVTECVVSFTQEFKELFIEEYKQGKLPRQILIDHGYDAEMLGDKRVWSISQKIRQQYAKHNGSFLPDKTHTSSSVADKDLSDKEQIKQLRQRVDYLEQQMEFLKKISSIRTTRK